MSRVLIYNISVWQWKGEDSVAALIPFALDGSCNRDYIGDVLPLCYVTMHKGFISAVVEYLTDTDLSDVLTRVLTDFDVVIDGRSRLLLPGLVDSHIHVGLLGESHYFVDLSSCYSMGELLSTLREHIALHAEHVNWIVGVNWDQEKLQAYPSRIDLDSLACPKPMFLWRACWHIGVADSQALAQAGLLRFDQHSRQYVAEEHATVCPDGGVIERDESGLPTGILKERAVELVTALQQKGSSCSSPDGQLLKRRHILEGMQLCVGVGLTTVQTNDDYAQVAYKGLQSDGLLPLRVFLTPMHEELYRSADAITDSPVMPFRPPSLSNRTLTVNPSIGETELDASTQTSRLLVERLKIFSDGSLGAETAALRVPAVEGRSSATSKGVLINSRAALTAMICDASRAGFRVEVHAIGDAAAEHVLDCLEDSSVALMTMTMTTEETECTKEDPPSTARIVRPVLTHCQVLGADLIQRMNLLGAIANIQPSFIPTDMAWIGSRISPSQLEYSYVWRTLLEQSVLSDGSGSCLRVAGGSDAPIEVPNPFTGMYDAIFRSNKQRIKSSPSQAQSEVFQPAQCLSFSQALWLYTIGGAYASECENILGQIRNGFIGDVVLVNPDIVRDNELLYGLVPDAVLVGGRVEFISSDSVVEVRYCESIRNVPVPPPMAVPGTEVDLSSSAYLPGKGGRVVGGIIRRTPTPTTIDGSDTHCPPQAWSSSSMQLQCACIMKGKYCGGLRKGRRYSLSCSQTMT